MIEFQDWGKTARHFRDIIITEKIDGTNAAIGIVPIDKVYHSRNADVTKPYTVDDITVLEDNVFAKVEHDGEVLGVYAQSRNRLIRPGNDNYGFAGWVARNAQEIVKHLGTGLHFGEWWGSGIQRGYGLTGADKRFSLFNTHAHWDIYERSGGLLRSTPVLYQGPNTGYRVEEAMTMLEQYGSEAATGYAKPEGVCVYHTATRQVTKTTFEHDNGKWQAA